VKIYNSIEEFSPDFNVVLTLGTFDGVHIGHQFILKELNSYAKKIGGESTLLTFYPHPRHVLFPDDQDLNLLTTIEERSRMLEDYGLKHLIVQEFSPKFSRIQAVNFVRDILVNKLKTSRLIIGYDHHFGRNREGNFDDLVKLSDLYGYSIEKIEPQMFKGVSVSSSKIRKLIINNNIEEAADYLGHFFFLTGKVIQGKQNGRKIGFPTANIHVENKWKLIPNDGVYAVIVEYKSEKFSAMMNIGYNPTYHAKQKTLEVHVFDFEKDIYGDELRIEFVKKIRKEKKFNSELELRTNLKIDENKIRNLLKYKGLV
tara:strand:- start:791 stop:1732 length:942 start_codon:yes stop_codon:yes gene_type:complete